MEKIYPLTKFSDTEIGNLLNDPKNPVVFTYLIHNEPVSIPVWTNFENGKFYIFTEKKSGKVKSIQSGSTNVALTIIQRELYPHPDSTKLSYLGIRGMAAIIGYRKNNDVANIQLRLLEKYDQLGEHQWIDDLVDKLKKYPQNAWLIEIRPKKWFSY